MIEFVQKIDSGLLWKSGRCYETPTDSYAGHAEKQNMQLRLNQYDYRTTGITRPMCNNCVAFFDQIAAQTGKNLFTADPQNITIFVPGTVPNNAIHFKIDWMPNGSVD